MNERIPLVRVRTVRSILTLAGAAARRFVLPATVLLGLGATYGFVVFGLFWAATNTV